MQIVHHLSELWKKNKKSVLLWNTVYKHANSEGERVVIGRPI